jgi:chromosome segregation ATPase
MTKLFEETTTAASAAKALDVSRRTVNRYLADGRLHDGGLGPDGERRITLSSLTKLKGELDNARQHVRGHDEGADAIGHGSDSILNRTLAMLEEELRARRDEVERTREGLLIAERSTATLEAERDHYKFERDRLVADLAASQEKADKARQALATVTEASPFTRWKARKHAAKELASL